jgi:hypothetical protein
LILLGLESSQTSCPGITVFELARVMGTSVEMIERHYGALLDGSGASNATDPASRAATTVATASTVIRLMLRKDSIRA